MGTPAHMPGIAGISPNARLPTGSSQADPLGPPSSTQFGLGVIQIRVPFQDMLGKLGGRIRSERIGTDRHLLERAVLRTPGRSLQVQLIVLADRSTSRWLYLSGESPWIEGVGRVVLAFDASHQFDRVADIAKYVHRFFYVQGAFFDHIGRLVLSGGC